MADIFLSYSSSDRDRVTPIVAALERRGWSVWWDRAILPGGAFEELIDEAIAAARCVVVAWSKTAVESRWVKNEALEGMERDILVPLMLEEVRIPVAFRQTQAARLIGRDLDPASEGFLKLLDGVAAILGVASEPLPDETPQGTATNSVAVLPFRDMSSENAYGWLGDGIAEDLINGLSQLSDLQVASRGDAFSFRESHHRTTEIGKALGVSTVLDGSVRVIGDRARILVELVSVADGFHLWSGKFDGSLEDAFSFQDEIVLKVIGALKIALTENFREQLAALGSKNIEAHRLLQQSIFEVHSQRVETLERILELEPEDIGAHRLLISTLEVIGSMGGVTEGSHQRLRDLRENIMRVDANDVRPNPWFEPYTLLAGDWNWQEAAEVLIQTVRLGNYPPLDRWVLRAMGLHPLVLLHRMALESGNFYQLGKLTAAYGDNPKTRLLDLVWAALGSGRYDDAIRFALSTLAIQPKNAFVASTLIATYIKTGRYAEAREFLPRFGSIGDPKRAKFYSAMLELTDGDAQTGARLTEEFDTLAPGMLFMRGVLQMYLGEVDTGFDHWHEAVRRRDIQISWINFMYTYAPDFIVDDARFNEIRIRCGRSHAWKLELGARIESLGEELGKDWSRDTEPQFARWIT